MAAITRPVSPRGVALFAATLFLNSALLFCLQPMFAKMILPLLGGAPAVWNTCMVFYQAALLGGYAYAHWSVNRLNPRRQFLLHAGIFFAGFLFLPASAAGRIPPPASNPIPWLIGTLTASIGIPFLALSANSSMLQSWLARNGGRDSRDPYFLYQASNLGSMAALVAYPSVIEPFFHLSTQSRLWTFSYLLVAGLTLACGGSVWKSVERPRDAAHPQTRLSGSQKIRWLALAFVPSSLMLSVTTYLTTCISPVPLLWVIPLAIYLGTYAIVFGRKPLIKRSSMILAQPLLLLPLLFLMMTDAARPAWAIIPLHLAVLFATAMVCHGELAETRPSTEHLTEFYLWIAVGGACGGVFNALLAPVLFHSLAEYSLTLVLACMLRPRNGRSPALVWGDLGYPGLIAAATLLISWGSQHFQIDLRPVFAIPAILCLTLKDRPVRFGLGIGAALMLSLPYAATIGMPLHVERSFFGVQRVLIDHDKKFHWLTHGSIVHGLQSLDPDKRREPLAYFHRAGPLGQLFAALGDSINTRPAAVIGLGAGSIACYGRPHQPWVYYEIDPLVEKIARNEKYFTFLRDCPPDIKVVLGDARLSLQNAPDKAYHLLILDAFSSDTIPIHLLTREALRLYLAKLDDHGLLIFHISNGYLNLKPVVGSLARDQHLTSFFQDYEVDESEKKDGKLSSTWAVLARDPADLKSIAANANWAAAGDNGKTPWTDDFSNIISILQWR